MYFNIIVIDTHFYVNYTLNITVCVIVLNNTKFIFTLLFNNFIK